jgi:hypothetical protein
MKIALSATLLAALIALCSPMALAQEVEGPGKACKADRQKFCGDLKPGDGKMGACMKQHEAELSAECAAARKAVGEARRNIRMNCKADADKFCADAAKEQNGMVKCLESHASELGEACAEALKSRPGAKKA